MSHKITAHNSRLVVRITIRREVRYIYLPVKINMDFWSRESDRPTAKHPNCRHLLNYIEKKTAEIDDIMLEAYANRYTADAAKSLINEKLNGSPDMNSLRKFSAKLIERFLQQKQPGNARWYQIAVDQFLEAANKKDLAFNQITYSTLFEFRTAKEKQGCKPNTINNYLRAIRAIYREADRQDVFKTTNKYPFQPGIIPAMTRPMNKNISQDDIKKLEGADFDDIKLQRAVDLFLAAFYLQGADYVDLAGLTKFNQNEAYLHFTRAKTGQPVTVRILPRLQILINKYTRGQFLFGIISGFIKNAKDVELYQNSLKNHNKYIKKAAIALNIDSPITSKWVRHSWITIAKRLYIDEDIRKQAVGHRNQSGAHSIYSDDFDQSVIDAANELVNGLITIEQYREAI